MRCMRCNLLTHADWRRNGLYVWCRFLHVGWAVFIFDDLPAARRGAAWRGALSGRASGDAEKSGVARRCTAQRSAAVAGINLSSLACSRWGVSRGHSVPIVICIVGYTVESDFISSVCSTCSDTDRQSMLVVGYKLYNETSAYIACEM